MRPQANNLGELLSAGPVSWTVEAGWRRGRGPAAGAIVLLVVLGLLAAWRARVTDDEAAVAGASSEMSVPFEQDHPAWTVLVQRYVHDGLVDYAGLKKNGQADLGRYLRSLESVSRGHYDSWSREQKLAFWINAYNAYTVWFVLDHYPLKSIRSVGLLPGAAFQEHFIPIQRVRGQTLSLNDIEHEILRKEFQEPRIHFAIVCASRSCPVLRSEAYRAKDLDSQLDEAARTFIRDASKNRFDPDSRTLRLSSIFKWFREDFERAAKTLPEFVAPYADEPTARALRGGGVRVEFLDYDWSLNGR